MPVGKTELHSPTCPLTRFGSLSIIHHMSQSSVERSNAFLEIAGQFKLGELLTESSHPVTAQLSEVAERDIAAALRLLFEVDGDVVRKYREFTDSGRAQVIANAVVASLRSGGRIFFTGCGATGRLSIQLASIWRDYWQRARLGTGCPETTGYSDIRCFGTPCPETYEDRAVSIMAGGDYALIKSVEGFEDFTQFGRKQIADAGVRAGDVVFAITEGGETSFVIGTAWQGVDAGAKVYFIYNNPDEVLIEHVQRSREVIEDPRIEKINLTTGPMAITGSTRMQATSIQLSVMLAILEAAIRRLVPDPQPPAPNPLVEMHAVLRSRELLAQLARLVAMEESIYRHGHRINYFAGRFAIDVLTDTTERSPTYCTPPFRKFDDSESGESWAYLFVPASDSPSAWRFVLKREPECIVWSEQEVRSMVAEETAERQYGIVKKIGLSELMRFRIGLDGLPTRVPRPGDGAVAIVHETEKDALLQPDGFFRKHLEEARAARARTGLIYFGSESSIPEIAGFVAEWNPECIAVLVPLPETGLLLDGITRVGVKMLLNALSTCTMVRLGRVQGNYMVWVVPSNLKLIDRATRYVSGLTGLGYEEANRLLFDVIEYIEPRMKSDQPYPPVVVMSTLRAKHGLSNDEAESRLQESAGLL